MFLVLQYRTFCEMVSRQEQTDDDIIIAASYCWVEDHTLRLVLKKRATLIYEASSFLYLLIYSYVLNEQPYTFIFFQKFSPSYTPN